MLKVVHDEAEPNEASGSVLDEIVREAARQMLAVALRAEVSAYIDAHAEEVDENGHRLVVRNGHHIEREVITAAGPVPVLAPRVNDKSHRSGHWGAGTVRFGDSARVGTQVAAGGRGAAAAVPARPVQLGFRSGVDAVPAAAVSRTTMLAFSALGNRDALATSRRMSRPDIGLAMTPTVASATRWRLTRQPLACCSPIALPARRRRACRLRDTRFRSR